MPKERKSQFGVLCGLKELSDEADHLIQEESQKDSALDEWFAAMKEAIIRIKNCKSVKDIEYPYILSFCCGKEDDKKKNDPAVSETQKENVHGKKNDAVPSVIIENTASEQKENCKPMPVVMQLQNLEQNIPKSKKKTNEKVVTPTPTPKKKENPSLLSHPMNTPIMDVIYIKNILGSSNLQVQQVSTPEVKIACNKSVLGNGNLRSQPISTPKMEIACNNSILGNNLKSQHLMQTPILNRTFNKILDRTIVLESGSSISTDGKSNVINADKDSGVKTRSGSKRNLLRNDVISNNNTMVTRSGSKRKSSASENKANKKQKPDTSAAASANKVAQPKQPLLNKNSSRTAPVLAVENKSKISAVIVPSMQQKHSVVPKEKLILEEIKKKEEKASQNIKRVLAERQLKAEQIKKNREEKRTKTLQKRMQMEKEKEERLEKQEKKAKSQTKVTKENIKNPAMKNRTKELIEEHAKESSSMVLTSKQNGSNVDAVVKTPVNKKSDECENYELTPLPDSSTYNFSDDEDDKPSGKPIPQWAQGIHLKSALIQQHYNPVDTDELFGTSIDTPDLMDIFKLSKKRYLKRTSSAVWASSPDYSYHY